MAVSRELVLGPMPEHAVPESHIASGPWCFSGREEAFPGWDGSPCSGSKPFPLPPDPYASGKAVAEAARAANAEALRLARLTGPRVFADIGSGPLSSRFHDMALGPYMLLVVHMLAERQKRAEDLVGIYGNESLRVALLPPDRHFAFRNCEDFKKNGVHDATFNHYVYSRILEAIAPSNWELYYTNIMPESGGSEKPASVNFKARCRLFLRKRLRDLPFPRYKGFNLWQVLLLSLAVLRNKRTKPDATIDFSSYCSSPLEWRFPAEKLILACLPSALQERPAFLRRMGAPSSTKRPGPLRGMTAAYMEDDAYRLRLAALRERGYRLFSVQHGANYGNLLSLGSIPFEYGMHAFYTWGWNTQKGFRVNALPLPHPALHAIAGKHKETGPKLILVGAEMSGYSYRLKSRPQAGALLEYRRSKLLFLRAMQDLFKTRQPAGPLLGSGEPSCPQLLYRPYFNIPGGLDDAGYVRRHMLGLDICTGDLTSHMLSCRLLVLDHYGTTLHMALAADVPCLAYWDRDGWSMDADSEKILETLRSAGILHDTPESAAHAAARIWEDVRSWWHSGPIRAARQCWLDRYAVTTDKNGQRYTSTDLARLWFESVRNA